MPYKSETPFDNIESALEYVTMLVSSIEEAREDVLAQLEQAESEPGASRRAEALRLVTYKMDRLGERMKAGHRLLNDLRTLRRLLLDERGH